MAIIPLWLDYPTSIKTTETYLDYEIALEDGTPIYNGRAFKMPGADTVKIALNEICAPYVGLTTTPPQGVIRGSMAKGFKISAMGKSQYFAFGADYSYRIWSANIPSVFYANDPITGILARKQRFFIGVYNLNYDPQGHSGEDSFVVAISGPGVEDKQTTQTFRDASFETRVTMAPAGYNRMELRHASQRIEYTVVDNCVRYVLYYVNAYGAWDSLLVDGTAKETDEYTRTTFKQAYDTSVQNIQPRGTVVLQNDYTKKYSLVTGWLTDDQASRMHHLLGSTNVYLHDMVAGTIVPVVLTNSSCEYKTFRNQGAHLVNYTIEATVAQDFTRR